MKTLPVFRVRTISFLKFHFRVRGPMLEGIKHPHVVLIFSMPPMAWSMELAVQRREQLKCTKAFGAILATTTMGHCLCTGKQTLIIATTASL